MINSIVLGVAIVLLILVAIALVHMIHILSHTTHLLQAIILFRATHLTLANASTIYKTMSMSDLAAQEDSMMADQRMKDMSVVHWHLPMAIERRRIELQLMNFIEITIPKTMLMRRMVVI